MRGRQGCRCARSHICQRVRPVRPGVSRKATVAKPVVTLEADSKRLLDWPALCKQVAHFCSTTLAAQACLRGDVPIGATFADCRRLQAETHEAVATELALAPVLDISALVAAAATRSAILEPEQLCAVGQVLECLLQVREELLQSRDREASLAGQATGNGAAAPQIPPEATEGSSAQPCASGNSPPGSSERSSVAVASPGSGVHESAAAQDSSAAGHLDGHTQAARPVHLAAAAERISPGLQAVCDAVQAALDRETCAVLDSSSPTLQAVRRRRAHNSEALQREIKHWCLQLFQQGASTIKSPVIRRDRFVCSVKRGRSGVLPKGSVTVEKSQSGATLFMEPKPVIEMNNAEVTLAAEEEEEVLRVLKTVTAMVGDWKDGITEALAAAVVLDLACARARHSRWLQATRPKLITVPDGARQGWAHLPGLRHPLLLEPSLPPLPPLPDAPEELLMLPPLYDGLAFAVRGRPRKGADGAATERPSAPQAIDLCVPAEASVAAITGPNTGGKTAALKTLGISVLMAKAGLFLHTADSGGASEDRARQFQITCFDNVLADLGDSQSLEQSLSTFSGHIVRVRDILEVCDASSLVLLDELGSGTDPVEGSAIAVAILRELSSKVAFTFTTSHHAEVKEEADRHPAFVNAAVEFNVETLSPTYRLLWGASGASNALAVARTLNFDRTIVEEAERWKARLVELTQSETKSEQMLEAVNEQLSALRKRRPPLDALTSSLRAEVQTKERQLAELRAEKERLQVAHNAARNDAYAQVHNLRSIPQKVATGGMKAAEAKQLLEGMLEGLPAAEEVADARQRLLALQMGVAVTKEEASDSESEEVEPAWLPALGETVMVLKMGGVKGEVLQPPSSGSRRASVEVSVGGLAITCRMSEIRKAPASLQQRVEESRQWIREAPAGPSGVSEADAAPAEDYSSEITRVQTDANTVDLRGKRSEAAIMQLEQELFAKAAMGVVFVIHGIGTGVLRKQVHAFLKREKAVTRFSLEERSNGGCTVVELATW